MFRHLQVLGYFPLDELARRVDFIKLSMQEAGRKVLPEVPVPIYLRCPRRGSSRIAKPRFASFCTASIRLGRVLSRLRLPLKKPGRMRRGKVKCCAPEHERKVQQTQTDLTWHSCRT